MNTAPSPAVTGEKQTRERGDYVVYRRTFAAPIEDVWAAVTEPERLQRWIGTWEGDPASGSVAFRMTAEGEDVAAEPFEIKRCEPPRALITESYGQAVPDGESVLWRLELDLDEADGITTLTFAQLITERDVAGSVGPGWEYYLDRLVAAETGADVGAVAWASYEGFSERFASQFD